MIEIVHHDERCIKGTPDAVIIAEREAAEYNPVAIASEFPMQRWNGGGLIKCMLSRGIGVCPIDKKCGES